VPEADWTDSALPIPASLRELRLPRLSLSASSLRRVCSLPYLESLEVDLCIVQADDDNALTSVAQHSGSAEEASAHRWHSRTVFSIIALHAQQLRELDLQFCFFGVTSWNGWDF
jgi:hypothetical protein